MAITGEVIGFEKTTDGRNNLAIYVEFKNDGVVIPQNNVFSERQCWKYIAQAANFLKRTEEENAAWIKAQIEHQAGNYIKALAVDKLNDELLSKTLSKAVGITTSKDSVEVEYFEGVKITVYPDGTYS